MGVSFDNIKVLLQSILDAGGRPCSESQLEKTLNGLEGLNGASTFYGLLTPKELDFKFLNPEMVGLLGLEKGETGYFNFDQILSHVHPEDLEHWHIALKEMQTYHLANTKMISAPSISYTWNLRIEDATQKYINLFQNITPLMLQEGPSAAVVLIQFTVLPVMEDYRVTASMSYSTDQNHLKTVGFNHFKQKLWWEQLSDREQEILTLVQQQATSKTIGQQLGISPNTVNTHRRNILKKLNVSSTGELIGILKASNM
ncbi:helix-turn-helix transcriptional regulator [Hyunsoonleella sp. SJ7]|uniref:Helix-turn-helix transcriptional regulator n=1 Tax=Hyunsoonleella aquatilis TaxID=2762758 RepID=A0A923H9C9_9FLAO|nr:helix-turn-helix transcriptional regulator [Hyunsoonleella aquatilis]MBC3759100.1 helix-turn-helix transcriptional regulator [Hyunsoonleella aquatilis]